MKHFLLAVLAFVCLGALAIVEAQDKPAAVISAPPVVSKAAPIAIALSEDDQKLLGALSAQISKMQPNVAEVEKQAKQFETQLLKANAWIAEYNQFIANREALLNRVAADVCRCKTSEIELSPDGKSVVKLPKPEDKPKP